jgi:DNA-binding response OmpR family regulator
VTLSRTQPGLTSESIDSLRERVVQELGTDLVYLVDLSDDVEDGLETIRRLRESTPNAVIAAIGGQQGTAAVAALEEGADVHMPEATRISHVNAQLRAILRRSGRPEPKILSSDGLRVDTGRREVSYEQRPIPLTPNEFKLLSRLVENQGQVVINADLLSAIHRGSTRTRARARGDIKVWIRRLRLKLEEARVTSVSIKTVRGFGYMLTPDA